MGMRIEWTTPAGVLRLEEPSSQQVVAASELLAGYYNEPHNRAMMTNTLEMSPEELVGFYAEMRQADGRAFFLYLEERLLGDADLRNFRDGCAEAALLVGPPGLQGRGLGTRFYAMLHAFGFRVLGLRRIYSVHIPANAASARMCGKVGCMEDESQEARGYAEAEDDVVLSVGREGFEQVMGGALEEIRFYTPL